MYDSEEFEKYDSIEVNLMETDSREPNQVISMQKSIDEETIAIITGKKLMMNE